MSPRPDDQVTQITTTPPITLEGEATLREVAQTLHAADIGAVVVLPSGGHTVAIVSERDIVRALAEGADPDEVWAADVMTEEPHSVAPSHTIRAVADEMLASGVRHLLVIDDGELTGIVSARDVLRVMVEARSSTRPSPSPGDARAVVRELAHPGG